MQSEQHLEIGAPRRFGFLFALLPIVLVAIFGHHLGEETSEWLAPEAAWGIGLFGMAWLVAAPVWIWRRRGERIEWPTFSFRLIAVEALIAVPVVFAVVVAISLVVFLLDGVPQADDPPSILQEVVDRSGGQQVGWLVVLAGVLAPISEEVFFRKFLFTELRGWVGPIGALLLQSVIFASVHAYEGAGPFAALVLVAFAFQGIYQWRKTLLAPMLAHGFFNVLMIGMVLGVSALPSPFLGVQGVKGAEDCEIESVMPGSSAEQAGLLPGDVIVEVNGEPIGPFSELSRTLKQNYIGDPIRITFLRAGESVTIDAVLGSTADIEEP